jgi:hypothetical protein
MESADDEEFTVAIASAALLSEVALIMKDKVWEPVCNYFQEKLCSPNWLDQHSGMLALAAVMNGPSI